MEIKNKHVAVALDNNGKCEFVAKVKVINDKELNRLINEKEQKKSYENLQQTLLIQVKEVCGSELLGIKMTLGMK